MLLNWTGSFYEVCQQGCWQVVGYDSSVQYTCNKTHLCVFYVKFAEDWEGLIEWLDSTKDSLNKLMEQRPSPARMKEIIDEIKVSTLLDNSHGFDFLSC